MFDRLKNRLKFQIEQLLLRGAHSRLLFIASLVGMVAIGGGLVVQATDTPFDGHKTAIWWAFLRLTDPGYLGDDETLARRVISTMLTVLGYVLFMGSLIAIMTQWLNQKIRNFESGLTPIVRRNHILILGWTNRTPAIVEELMRSEGRVRRFLQLRGARGLHVVILSENVNLERTMELRRALGPLWDARKITFRSGIPLRLKHLERVDFRNASAIILPGADFAYGGATESDTRIIKTVLSITNQQRTNRNRSLRLLVTEIFDPSKIQMIQRSYQGVLEILASDLFITRCIVQNVRHPGLSYLFHQILVHGHGSSIYIRTFESFAGSRFGDLTGISPKAILLGVVRPHGEAFRPMLNPSGDLILEPKDRFVFFAQRYEDCEILKNPPAKQSQPQSQRVSHIQVKSMRRILILGWNHKVVPLIKELSGYLHEQFEVSILSLKPSSERAAELGRKETDQHRVGITHYEGDHTSLSDLADLDLTSYDNVVMLGSDWVETQEESDARTIVGHLVLKNILEGASQKPEILVDLMDADNVGLFQDEDTEVLVTPMMVSHMLAQVALRRELNVVYAELFGPGGAEIFFRPVADYGIVGRKVSFGKLKNRSADRGEIALGIRPKNSPIELNPAQNETYILQETDDLVVLVREAAA
jgi:hypothetical protein